MSSICALGYFKYANFLVDKQSRECGFDGRGGPLDSKVPRHCALRMAHAVKEVPPGCRRGTDGAKPSRHRRIGH